LKLKNEENEIGIMDNILKFAKCNWWLIILVVIGIIAAGYFGHHPTEYNAACQVFITLLVAVFSVFTGLKYDNEKLKVKLEEEKRKAQLDAIAKWMPMAISCISRLLTMQNSINSIKDVSIKALSTIYNSNSLECSKTIASAEINNRENSYNSIYDQLNDDIEDWKRFVEANCQGDECSEVNNLIESKRNNHDNPSSKG
jgi:hypothetical protein